MRCDLFDDQVDTDKMKESESAPQGDDSARNDTKFKSEQSSDGGFVAGWILENFPDIRSEMELKSQVEQADHDPIQDVTHMDSTALVSDTTQERSLCEECRAFSAVFVCKDCALTLCFRCTDAIHIIPSLSTHTIRLDRSSTNHAPGSSNTARMTTIEPSLSPHVKASPLSLAAGTSIFFRASDCSRWSRELLHGTLISREAVMISSGNTFYHRVLWLRGVEALTNGFFRAALTVPGWNDQGDNSEIFWPYEVGVFPTQLSALRAVVTAEQLARATFRRELEGGRIHRRRDHEASETFPSSKLLEEIVAETIATLDSEYVRFTREDDAKFHQELVQGTWSFHKWMKTIGRAGNLREEDAVSVASRDGDNATPWTPATRIRFFLIAQHDVVFPEHVRRQHLRVILDQLLFVYAGFAWRLWTEYVAQDREREIQQQREDAACLLQAWARRMADHKRQKQLQVAVGSSIDALELRRRQQLEARKLYVFLTQQIKEQTRKALKRWREAVGPRDPPPSPATTWHPSHGMTTMLAKLPRLGARRRPVHDKSVASGTQVIVEDMATYKLFKANHAGPADTSYWVIRARVLAGACPIGPAFREARRLVSRTDFATCILLQQISVFVCLLTPEERGRIETAGASNVETSWSCECLVRTKYQALCAELKGAETSSKRHVELAQQALVAFDVGAATVAAAAIGSSGIKNRKKASMSQQQQQEDDAAEEAKTKEAREILEQKLQLAEQQARKATQELARLGRMTIEFLYFPIEQDGVPDSEQLTAFLQEQVECRLRAGKNLYVFSRLGHGRTGLVAALLLGRVYGITASEALERAQRVHDCQRFATPRGWSFCSPSTAPQMAFVRRVLARSMDPIYVPLVLENSAENFRSTRMQQRGLLAEPYLNDEGFMISAAGDAQARAREAREQQRLERITRRESTAAALQRERRQEKQEDEAMECEEYDQIASETVTSIYDKIQDMYSKSL